MLEQTTYGSQKGSCTTSPLPERSLTLYRCSRDRGRRGQFWSKVTGGSRGLLNLKAVEASCEVLTQSDGGRQSVPISQIRGSEGRAADFDRDFNPLQDYTRKRWLGIAAARERGTALPPVSLVQVGDIYFVKDGHHRISVARAFGQEAIGAKVVAWQVEGTLLWETPAGASACTCASQSTSVRAVFSRLRRAVAGVPA